LKFNNGLKRSLSIILIILIFSALGILGYINSESKIGQRFTEFYILGLNDQAQNYPTDFILSNEKVANVLYDGGIVDSVSGFGKVTLGIVNHEQQTIDYSVKIVIDNELVNNVGPIKLQKGEKWENLIGIVPQHIGYNQEIKLLLFKGVETEPENSLHFWINVIASE
jgi:uncharacterized membrane protein